MFGCWGGGGVVTGAQWIIKGKPSDAELWEGRRATLVQTCPSAQVRIEEGQWCIVVFDFKSQLTAQAQRWTDEALKGWKRRQAQTRMSEFVGLLGQA